MTELRYADRKRKYYEAHKEEINARSNQWRKDNPEKNKIIQEKSTKLFREKLDREYPGGYKAYQADAKRRYRAKKKAEAEAKAQAAMAADPEQNNPAQPTQ